MDPDLPAPARLDAPPRVLLGELRTHLDEPTAADLCADLLGGADAHHYPTLLPYLAGRPAQSFLDGTWGPDYWSRVWGARGLLYVWSESAAGPVLGGVGDQAWRVAEMCLKVSVKRGLPGADGAAALADHELARLRVAAMRTLAAVGDTEHVRVVRQHLDDPDADVRRQAARALETLRERLDLPDAGG